MGAARRVALREGVGKRCRATGLGSSGRVYHLTVERQLDCGRIEHGSSRIAHTEVKPATIASACRERHDLRNIDSDHIPSEAGSSAVRCEGFILGVQSVSDREVIAAAAFVVHAFNIVALTRCEVNRCARTFSSRPFAAWELI